MLEQGGYFRGTRIVAWYSPAGGTGKTTLALAMATVGAKAGLRTLYLNLEDVDSAKGILEKAGERVSRQMAALGREDARADRKVRAGIRTVPEGGFDYLPGVEHYVAYGAMTGRDVGSLLEQMENLETYDLVIVDLASGFTDKTEEVLRRADQILVPVLMEETSIGKLQCFLRGTGMTGKEQAPFVPKMGIVLNRAGAEYVRAEALPEDIRSRIPYWASVMETLVFMKKSRILRSGDIVQQMMGPVLRQVMGTEGTCRYETRTPG